MYYSRNALTKTSLSLKDVDLCKKVKRQDTLTYYLNVVVLIQQEVLNLQVPS